MEQREALEKYGKALFGNQWVNQLAVLLDVHPRTFRRWANETEDVPTGVWLDIKDALILREQEVRELIKAFHV